MYITVERLHIRVNHRGMAAYTCTSLWKGCIYSRIDYWQCKTIVSCTKLQRVGPSDNGSKEFKTSRSNANESYVHLQLSSKIYNRRSEKRWAQVCRALVNCTMAAIWYVITIDVLRSVASTLRCTSNVINSLLGGNTLNSLQTDLLHS